ncbi:MAG: ROK family protein [Candidatus Saccharibacteria bacterium]|nr:ROK family protein [Candidatus Saccharibacteria bacterium]
MYLAIDIGGTKTLIALFTKHGRVIRRFKFRTAWKKEKFISDLVSALENFSRYSVRSVTVAIPGIVQKNCSVRLGNRDWGDFSLLPDLKNLFDCPIYFENDASLASVYESSGIPGKTVFLTFSTGIGGGIAENGKLLPSSAGFEPGHWIYEYNGKEAEWEDIAAASALGKFYHVDTATELRGKATMMDVAKRIELGVSDIIKKYSPDTIILGGPLGKIFRLYVKYLPKFKKVKYRRPKRPLESVIYGCYLYSKTKD